MGRRPPWMAIWALGVLCVLPACSGGAGTDGSEILVDFDQLPGGVVFATRAFVTSNGYDLFWVPVPAEPTVQAQPAVRLTESPGDELQPSVSAGGNGIAFARADNGIHLITVSGRIRRISDTSGTPFKDSSPAVSFDGRKVAFTREDTSQPIGDTGFFKTEVMIADADGQNLEVIIPATGANANIVQDAAVFEPISGSTRLAWSELDALSLNAGGPQRYGIRLVDFSTKSGALICQAPALSVDKLGEGRCFGFHLAWPIPGALVLPQQFLEIYVDGSPATSVYSTLVQSILTQQIGGPVLEPAPGFYAPFPLSASYQGLNRFIVDGLATSQEGSFITNAFYVAQVDGGNAWRLNIAGYSADYDPATTGGYLFSVATPQFIPLRQE